MKNKKGTLLSQLDLRNNMLGLSIKTGAIFFRKIFLYFRVEL